MLTKGSDQALWLTIATAAMLAFPIELPALGGYAPTLTFVLAPIVAWAVLAALKKPAGMLFALAGICGIAGILISYRIQPDGRLHLDLLSLVLLMYTAGFYFLGLRQDPRFGVCFVLFSAAFLVPATFRNLFLGEQIHAASSDNYNVLNVKWFGWSMFGNFGILGAAHMICLQVALAIGVALDSHRMWIRVVALAVIVCGAVLVVGSESRSAVLALFIAISGGMVYISKTYALSRRNIAIAVAVLVCFSIAGVATHGGRLAQTVRDIVTVFQGGPVNTTTLDAISSNRFSLQLTAIKEFIYSPTLGSGFSPLGRYLPIPGDVEQMTPHLFYLTVLWKGGLLFSIPFFAFFAVAVASAWRAKLWRRGPLEFMAMVAIALMFGFMALTAETPNVPSAGALAFLLLGSLSEADTQQD